MILPRLDRYNVAWIIIERSGEALGLPHHLTKLTTMLSMRRLLVLLVITMPSAAQADPVARADTRPDRAAERARKAQTEFDAVALQAMIAPMVSGMKSGPLGAGQAGRYWQSLMTEHIARHIASSGRLQLLTKLPSTHPSPVRTRSLKKRMTRDEGPYDRAVPATAWETMIQRTDERGPGTINEYK